MRAADGVVSKGKSAEKKAEGRTQESRRIPELDGIRGLAILMVLCLHTFHTPTSGGSQALEYVGRLFALGWSGVDLFFVLSGFLIGGILVDNRESRKYFQTFYARRFFRIMPVYYAWILLFVLAVKFGGGLLHQATRSGVVPAIDWTVARQAFFLQNLWNQNYVKLAYWWFAPSWSLAVEEQFYLCVPLLVRYLPKRLLPAVLAGIVATAPILRYTLHLRCVAEGVQSHPAYRLMPCRADSLAVGMLLAYGWRNAGFREWVVENRLILYATFGVLLAGVIVMACKTANPLDLLTQTIGYSALAFFYGALVLLTMSQPRSWLARMFRLEFLRELGRVSYCMYLIHLAVGYFCFGIISHQIVNFATWRSGCIGLLSIVTAYAIACVSWKVLEEPMLRLGHRYRF